jgi:hypothetical protein
MAQTYTFRLTAEGLDKFKADLTALGAEGDRVFNQMRQASPALQTAMERAEQATQRSTQALREHAAVNDNVNRGMSNLGQTVGQAGYQLQDFAVQVQAGTSWLTALSQQGSQFLGIFGTGGAIAGAVLAVGALAAGFIDTRSATDAAKDAAEAYKKSLETLSELMDSAFDKARKLREESAQSIIATQRRLAEADTRRGEDLGATILSVEEHLRAAQARRGFTPQGGGISDALNRNIADLERRLASLRGDSAIASAGVAEANRVIELARRGAGADLTYYEATPSTDPGTTLFPTDAISGPLQRMQEAQRRAAERSGTSRGGASPRLAVYGPGMEDYIRSQRTIWGDEDKAAAASAKAIEDSEKRQQASFDRTVERYSADLAKGTADALLDGGSNALPNLATAFSRALRTAVASALDVELFRPLISGLFGSLGFSGSTASGGGALSGLSGMFGLSGLGGQFSSLFGGQGGFLSGVGSSVSSLLGTPIFGSGALSSATNSALNGLGGLYGPATPGSLGLGGLTIGGAIGQAGLGFGAGSLAGSLVQNLRGTSGPGGSIGAAAGSLAGLAFGPIGALVGGVLGGAGGGLFGPTQKGLESRSGVAGIYTLDGDGYLKIQDVGGKRGDTAGFTAGLQSQLTDINTALQSRGLALGYGGGAAWSVGTGPAAAGLASGVDPNNFSRMIWAPGGGNVGQAVSALRGQGADFNSVLSSVDWVKQVYEPLIASTSAADQFQTAIDNVNKSFGDIISRAQQLGLATDALVVQRDKEIDAINKQREAQKETSRSGEIANGLFYDLAFGSGSALAPETQYFAATSALRAAGRGLAGGGEEALSKYTSVARLALPAIRAYAGTSEKYGDIVAEVSRNLRVAAPGAEMSLAALLEGNATGTDRLVEVTAAFGSQQVEVLQGIRTEISTLSAQITGILARIAA